MSFFQRSDSQMRYILNNGEALAGGTFYVLSKDSEYNLMKKPQIIFYFRNSEDKYVYFATPFWLCIYKMFVCYFRSIK